MKILYATGNNSKLYNMRRRLERTGIEVISPRDLNLSIDVVEDGKTTLENAIKKAQAYYEIVKMPVFSGDTAVYLDGIPDNLQPGLYVRRVNNRNLTDEEMIEYYSNLTKRFGNKCIGYYETGIAFITDGKLVSHTIKEPDFLLISERDPKNTHRGNPLEVITWDLMFNKYWSEMTDEEWKIRDSEFDQQVRDVICKELIKKQK